MAHDGVRCGASKLLFYKRIRCLLLGQNAKHSYEQYCITTEDNTAYSIHRFHIIVHRRICFCLSDGSRRNPMRCGRSSAACLRSQYPRSQSCVLYVYIYIYIYIYILYIIIYGWLARWLCAYCAERYDRQNSSNWWVTASYRWHCIIAVR